MLVEDLESKPEADAMQRVQSAFISKKEVFNYNELAKDAYGKDDQLALYNMFDDQVEP